MQTTLYRVSIVKLTKSQSQMGRESIDWNPHLSRVYMSFIQTDFHVTYFVVITYFTQLAPMTLQGRQRRKPGVSLLMEHFDL